MSKYNVGLKTLLLQCFSEPEFYGDLVYKFRKIIGKIDFPYHFKTIIVRYKKIGYNINVSVPGRPTILITVGQGPIALAVGAGGGGLDIFTLIYPFSSFSLSLGDDPI